jgi:hypothetical protein
MADTATNLRGRPAMRWVLGGGCCLLTMLLGLFLFAFVMTLIYSSNNDLPPDLHIPVFDTRRPYGETLVPFTLKSGLIVIQASFGKQKIDCVFDTGSRELTWQNIDLPSQPLHRTTTDYDRYSNVVPAEWQKVSSLKLGDYETKDICALKLYTKQQALIQAGEEPIQVVLGNRVFAHTIVTIDYKKQVLIVRRPDYDLSHYADQTHGTLLDFTSCQTARDAPLYIVVGALVAGISVQGMIDTGHHSSSFAIDQGLRNRLTSLPYNEPYGNGNERWWTCPVTELTQPIRWSLGNISGCSPAKVLNGYSKLVGFDANFGYEVLKNSRITIDYDRHKILLEPYQN